MGYLIERERDARLSNIRNILEAKGLDLALIYYDEFHIANAWYLTGWCPQFETGAVLVPREGEPMVLGGPESEPFAHQDSAITKTRNLQCFMVADEDYPNATIVEWSDIFNECSSKGAIKRAGLVGGDIMPVGVYRQVAAAFKGVELIDITQEYAKLRYVKSEWEREMVRRAFQLTDLSIEAMRKAIVPGATELQVAAAGEFAARNNSASGFGFTPIVGSGRRSNAVVPTASEKLLEEGEMVMLGIAPKCKGYAGVAGDTVIVGGKPSAAQKECLKHLSHTFNLTKEMLVPGNLGSQIDKPGNDYYKKIGWLQYLVCPFAHTIGIDEAEPPFWHLKNDTDVLKPGMTVCIDISFFGHPELNGARIETGYEITESGAVPLSPMMDKFLCEEIGR